MSDLIPPRPRPKHSLAPKMWTSVACGSAAALGAIAFVNLHSTVPVWNPFSNAPDFGVTSQVRAADIEWEATQIEWQEFMAHWELSTVLYASRSRANYASPDYDFESTIGALCGAILTRLPAPPAESLTRRDVFRLSLNFWPWEDGALTHHTYFDAPIALAIENGSCPGSSDLAHLSLSYPAPLDNWRLEEVGTALDAEATVVARFQAQHAQIGGFPSSDACRAVLLDLPRFWVMPEPLDGFEVLRVEAITLGDRGYVDAQEFSIANGACTPLEPGREI